MQTIAIKNTRTDAIEEIEQLGLTRKDWGFSFFVNSETEAFKAAYAYRHSPNGVRVEFAKGAGRWMVTVFNDRAGCAGIES
jgi:hypothetical protein